MKFREQTEATHFNKLIVRKNFKTDLIEGAELVGKYGFPKLRSTNYVPHDMIPFNMAKTERYPEHKWLHFFIDDYQFERVWNYPNKYLSLFNRFEGVVATDFSMLESMPKAQRIWNCYRNYVMAYWLQNNCVNIVPVVEWAVYSDLDWCMAGIPCNSTLAVGIYGCSKNCLNKYGVIKGVERVCRERRPTTLICYGNEIKAINSLCKNVIWIENYCYQLKKRV